MNEADDGTNHGSEPPMRRRNDGVEFSAPLGMLRRGRLVSASGMQGVKLTADPLLADLFWARFRHATPRIWSDGGIVTIKHRRLPTLDPPFNWRRAPAAIVLNGSIPWEIELRRGVSNLDADLSRLQLGSLDILGGASQIWLTLSRPLAPVFVYIAGGVSQGLIRAPFSVPIGLQISGGATRLTFDDQWFGAIGEEMRLQSPDFESATRRYDICIAGGATNLTVQHNGG